MFGTAGYTRIMETHAECSEQLDPVAQHSNVNGIAVDSASESVLTDGQVDEAHNENPHVDSSTVSADVKSVNCSVPCLNESNSDGVIQHPEPHSEQSSQTSNSATISEDWEQLGKLMLAFSTLENSNNELKTTVTENCRLIADLRTTCALLEKKNNELEQTMMKLINSDENTKVTMSRLSSEVAGLSAAGVSKHSVSEAGNGCKEEQTSDLPPQPTVEQRVAELELTAAKSSSRLVELSASVDNIERDLQRFIRRHSLVVENLCPKEDRSAQEAFLVFIKCVLGVTADESDIDGLHLVDKPEADKGAAANASVPTGSPAKSTEARPRPVLVTFTCYRTRMKVYKACFRTCLLGLFVRCCNFLVKKFYYH
jgi:hypothetical protein